jgi:hypothetical protein
MNFLKCIDATCCHGVIFHGMTDQTSIKGDIFVNLRHIVVLGGLLAGGIIGAIPVTLLAAQPAKEATPAISEEAGAALLRMGQTLRVEQFSFRCERSACIRRRAARRSTSFTR